MLKFHPQKVAWLLFSVWFGALWFLSGTPGREFQTLPFSLNDKVLHAGYFFAGSVSFAWLFCRARPQASSPGALVLQALVLFVAVGFLDEWHQTFVPGRSGGDVWDFVADVVGSVAGITTACLLSGYRESKAEKT